MIISEHAYNEMSNTGITEEEVKQCLEYGKLEITQIVKGEKRYGKKLDLKTKTIMVIYTIRENEERIVTAYIIKRKKWKMRNGK